MKFKIIYFLIFVLLINSVNGLISSYDYVFSGYHFTTPPDTAGVIVDVLQNQNLTNNGLDAIADKNAVSNQARDNVESNNDYLNASTQLITSSDWSISMWVSIDASETAGNFFCQRYGVNACAYYSGSDLYLDGVGNTSASRFNGDMVSDGTWRHYVFTFQNTGTDAFFYIDGVQMTQDATASITGIDNGNMLVMNGKAGASTNYFFRWKNR